MNRINILVIGNFEGKGQIHELQMKEKIYARRCIIIIRVKMMVWELASQLEGFGHQALDTVVQCSGLTGGPLKHPNFIQVSD
jgi:hypothetical protein